MSAGPWPLALIAPRILELHAALRQSVLALRHVLDLDLVEREGDALEDVGGTVAVTAVDTEGHHASLLDRDLHVFDLTLAGLPQRQDGLGDRLVGPQREHQRRR